MTGGGQLDGFVDLLRTLLVESGIPDAQVFGRNKGELPGFFRPTKQWDLLVVVNDELLAAVEMKSHVGPSFGNNFNNRAEEALGSATDLLTGYRDGALRASDRPWMGYLMLVEEAPGSTHAVRVAEPHFPVFPEFRDASYAKRYEILCLKLIRERLYDSACLLLSAKSGARRGEYVEPLPELGFSRFATSLTARATAFAKLRGRR